MIARIFLSAAFFVAVIFQPSWGQDKAQFPYIQKAWHGIYDVQKDGRVTETVLTRVQILQESMLERLKVYSFGYSTSTQTGEVLEAYTVKKNGTKIPVSPNNFQRQVNDGRKGASPFFSDRTRISVVFPDVEVGDSVLLRYQIAEKEPMFPGQFSLAINLSPYSVEEDSRITVRLPEGMAVKKEAYFFKAAAERVESGKRVLEWHYANLKPRRYVEEEDDGIWSLKEIPSVLVSTFANYEDIAKAYGDRALPKAQPTDRIRELTQRVLGNESRPREKARLLYEWVSRNLTYGGNCIGVGAVVPRDTDVVLENKMGDCKDHATLLQAMLSAADIPSEQALVNAGGQYELADTPVVSMVNHVMNFLPSLNLYVDATAKDVPFGLLPMGSYAKPVIRVGAAKAVAIVPNENHLNNEQHLKMRLKLLETGAATGEMEVSIKGIRAAQMRAYMRDMTADNERDFVKQALSSYGYRGRGKLEKANTEGLSDSYQYAFTFEIDDFLRSASSGAFVFSPVAGSPLSVMMLADVESRPLPKRRVPCHGFHTYETYVIELPPGMTVLDMPEDVNVQAALVDYSAKYVRTGSQVTVNRELHDKTPDSICSAESQAEFIKQARPIGENLRTQVLYKRKAR
ncbi:MAG: DUF3857 and transglutaminase domain-containing protein [Ramlibacter sp.]|nr:DUF3857 and transglutaminase domain-containing protein [Ramlibacter sp.]